MACAVPNTALAVHTDAHRLRQTLRYLIDNAIKFTPRGEVLVHAAETDDVLVIEVRDTGIGIAAPDLLHVFDDFRQVDARANRNFDGCGLGLAVSRRLVLLMGGYIEVESEPGRGSCFRLTLPRVLKTTLPTDADPLGGRTSL